MTIEHEREQTMAWVDRYSSLRFLLMNFLSNLSIAEEDAEEELRALLYRHRMAVLNQLALIEGRKRFVVVSGNGPSEAP